MLGVLSRQGRSLQELTALSSNSYAGLQQKRTLMQIFEIFSKEKREERRKQLQEDISRGHFADFKEFRQNKGKIFLGSERLIPASQARAFPPIKAAQPDHSTADFPPAPTSGGPAGATLACLAFKAGAQEMLEAWAIPFSQHFSVQQGMSITELSLVESAVMSVWPFKAAILRSGGAAQGKYQLPASYLFYFGNTNTLRRELLMTNRLTGYVYLVDYGGRVRWRGSGSPDRLELQQLLKCGEELLKEQQRGGLKHPQQQPQQQGQEGLTEPGGGGMEGEQQAAQR